MTDQRIEEIRVKIVTALDLGLQVWRTTLSRDRFFEATDALNDLLAELDRAKDRNVEQAYRLDALATALRQIADYGHELDDYVLPPKEARKIARAALSLSRRDRGCGVTYTIEEIRRKLERDPISRAEAAHLLAELDRVKGQRDALATALRHIRDASLADTASSMVQCAHDALAEIEAAE